MTPDDLKALHEEHNPDSHYFTRSTMKFFGDRMNNYGVQKAIMQDVEGIVKCWELYRKKPVKHHLQSSAYFDYRGARLLGLILVERTV